MMPEVWTSKICTAAVLAALPMPAAAELAEHDLQLLDCTARAMVVLGVLEDMVELDMDLPDGLVETADAQALGLLLTAEPLLSDEAGNAAMGLIVDAVNAERNVAREDGTSGEWLMGNFAFARNCHAELVTPEDDQ